MNASLMGVAVTGNGRRESFAHLPMPRMTNTVMLNGDRDPGEILASVKDGIYAVNFGGGQVDITSGKFVFSDGRGVEDRERQAHLSGEGRDADRQRPRCADARVDDRQRHAPRHGRRHAAARTGRACRSASASRRCGSRDDGGRSRAKTCPWAQRDASRAAIARFSAAFESRRAAWGGPAPRSTRRTQINERHAGCVPRHAARIRQRRRDRHAVGLRLDRIACARLAVRGGHRHVVRCDRASDPDSVDGKAGHPPPAHRTAHPAIRESR